MAPAPGLELTGDAADGPGVGEGGGAHLHGRRLRPASARRRRRPAATPPTPMMGRLGQCSVHIVDGPDRDRVDGRARQSRRQRRPRRGRRGLGIDGQARHGVDQRHGLRAGAATASATSTRSATAGVELGPQRTSGAPSRRPRPPPRPPRVAGRTSRRAPAARSWSRLGHDRLTSTATTSVGRLGQQLGRPAILVDGAAPDAGHDGGPGGHQRRAARRASQCSTPGSLQADRVEHPRRRLVHPGRRGCRPRARPTATSPPPPRARTGRRGAASSAPWPAVPDAVITGLAEPSTTDPDASWRTSGRRTSDRRQSRAAAGRRRMPRWYSCSVRTAQRMPGPVGHARWPRPGRRPPW